MDITLRDLEDYKYDVQFFVEKSKEIDKLKKEIEKMHHRLEDLKNESYDTSRLQDQLISIFNKQSLEEDILLGVLFKKQIIEKQIGDLPQPYKNIFFLKYIGMHTFDEIALKMNYSTKRIYQLHKKGTEIYCEQQKNTLTFN